MSGGNIDSPIMQVLGSKKLTSNNATERYRLLISDGKYHNSFAMIATQLNDLVSSGELSEFTIVKIKRYITSLFNTSEKERYCIFNVVSVSFRYIGLKDSNEKTEMPPENQPQATKPQANKAALYKVFKKLETKIYINKIVCTNIFIFVLGFSFGNKPKLTAQVSTGTIHPISSLSPYQNRWCIKARVTNKQAPRNYSSARGEGKLFSVVFTDESGEIKCTGFNSAVDKFSDLLQVSLRKLKLFYTYLFSNFLTESFNFYLVSNCSVQPCEDDVGLPSAVYNFVPISKLIEMSVDSIVDVIGVAKHATDVQNITARSTGRELKKREVVLVDSSGASVSMTLWGSEAVGFDCSENPVVAVKSARLTEFMGGKSLSVQMNSTVLRDPDIDEAHKLRGWWASGGSTLECSSISNKGTSGSGSNTNWVLFGDLTSQGLGLGDKADYFSAVVNVLMAKQENCIYKSCPVEDCKKKIIDLNNGVYRCEKCNREHNNFKYRMLLSAQVSDYSGSSWVTMFHEEAQKLLGVDAEIIGKMMDNNDESYKEYFNDINFKQFQMKFRTKMESYNDEKRLKTTVVNLEPIDYKSYARRLLEDYKTSAGITIKH
ncbi:Replication protein A 70 kDa DNA-binding subunit, putative [Pediculus humanus corporis]|uniref:Replication protein A subunit n=1 Tax=Pediculus humanus subsp. corporis TaxID=121224 RepID=E0VV73_PEDHC|nr:Replication protein A 70 kDa DNA-binding subunit, putative [Pediculus humanus corporis]EEB17279.1 Replication protein A 70 kDa DNA-binding subunit, putative [Pediculus humanus corporis]